LFHQPDSFFFIGIKFASTQTFIDRFVLKGTYTKLEQWF